MTTPDQQLADLIRDAFARRAPEPFVSGKTTVTVGWASYGPEEVQRVLRVLLSGWISLGPECKAFEEAFARYVGVRHGIAVNSGSSANLLALTALVACGRLPAGSEVLIPSATFATVASPIIQAGLRPVFVDVDPLTYNISAAEVEKAIGPNTKAVMVVHTLGLAADLDAILAVAKRHNLLVIEDCCEAHGTLYKGRKTGSFGMIATFSFYVAHNMTTGEGGMIVTNDPELDETLRSLREFGRQRKPSEVPFSYDDGILKEFDSRYVFSRLGYNVRMTDPVAAFGLEQLKKLNAFNAQRIETAAYYTKHLEPFNAWLQTPTVPSGLVHTYYAYPLMVRSEAPFRRAELTRYLESRKVETRALFGGSLADQPAFRGLGLRVAGNLRVSRDIRDRCFFIGCHPRIGQAERAYTIQCFKEFFGQFPGKKPAGRQSVRAR